jgi:hypothetical protein
MAGFACTVDVITWLGATFVDIGTKPTALSRWEGLATELLLLLGVG